MPSSSSSHRGQKIDVDATVAQHANALRREAHVYLGRAAKQNLPGPTRQRIVSAALAYLETRNRHATAVASQSQASSQLITQSVRPNSAFQTYLASLLDDQVSPHFLIDTCARATDSNLSAILIKCLHVLAKIGPIIDHKSLYVVHTQTQKEEEDIFGDENKNPQTQQPSQLGNNQVAVRRTGQSFVDDFVSRLAEVSGSQLRASPVFVASVAREAPLSHHAAQHLLSTLTNRLDSIPLLELPSFLYQLLLLASSKGTSSAKSLALLRIADVFARHEKTVRISDAQSQSILEDDEDAITPSIKLSHVHEVQGTALIHIEYAVKHDPSLSTELIKLAKSGVESPKHFLTSFGTGIVLSLSRAASVSTNVLSMLREAVQRFDREAEFRSRNLYRARVSLNDEALIDLHEILINIADSTCEVGWDFVKNSLLDLAFVLLDKPLAAVTVGKYKENLAESLISKLFVAHSSMRERILEQMTMRIAVQEKSAFSCIRIIRCLANRVPFFVLEHNRFIRDGIEYLMTLPPWMATALMEAYVPLLQTRQDLQDYFQLVVRKSLFHRDIGSRAVAIMGFMIVVSLCGSAEVTSGNNHSDTARSSQLLEDGQHKINAMIEASQPLRRVFSYSAPLKAFWYKNILLRMEEMHSEELTRSIASATSELLSENLKRFVDVTQAPFISVEHCVDEQTGGILVEPLGDLIWCLAAVEVRRDPEEYSQSFILDLARKVSSISLQDFAFTKEALTVPDSNENDFENDDEISAAAAARANRNKLRILGSVAEAFIHAVLIIPSDLHTWDHYSAILLPLLTLKSNIFEALRVAGVASVADAFSDFGGDLVIERLRPGMKMLLQRGGKTGNGSKKPRGQKKTKKSDADQTIGIQASLSGSHRFGVFNVLSSASSRPSLPLGIAVDIIQKMTSAFTQDDGSSCNNIFSEHTESRDFQEVRVYLLTVVHKHIEDYVSLLSRVPEEAPVEKSKRHLELIRATKVLVRTVMKDFRRFRRSSPDVPGQGGLKALLMAETCASAIMRLTGTSKQEVAEFCHALLTKPGMLDAGEEEEVFETATAALEKLTDTLLDDAMIKEAHVTLRLHSTLLDGILMILNCVDKQSAYIDKRRAWATQVVSERKIQDSTIVKGVVQLVCRYTANNNDLRRAGEICERLVDVLGDCNASAEPVEHQNREGGLKTAKAINLETSLATVDAILDLLDDAIVDVEWCLGRMTRLEVAASNATVTDLPEPQSLKEEDVFKENEEIAKQAIRAEDAAQLRLEGVLRTLTGLASCAVGKWTQQERLVRIVTKAYKVLTTTTQAQVKRKGDPRTSFVSLTNECKRLAPTIWTYLAFIGDEGGEENSGKSSKAAREARVMPQLVYEVERFEKVLMMAQKRTKIRLLQGMRRNIARDFRIREDRLRSNDEDGNEDGRGTNQESDETDSRMSGRRNGKRRRLS